ncbi:required for meiotic nuclear division protein 1 homolog [Cloeon dipterum]|uniref:required for meiotic nuclear division protein 1 homolog n=1 Tax=Cloeon dipterum TaxID=197152 RepID=UPI00322075F2
MMSFIRVVAPLARAVHRQTPIIVNVHRFASGGPPSLSALQIKKRKRKPLEDEGKRLMPGHYYMSAIPTAEEYDLQALKSALLKQDLYKPTFVDEDGASEPEVLHATAKYEVGSEPRDIFFFREGSLVVWNMNEIESQALLTFMKPFELRSLTEDVAVQETESMTYSYSEHRKSSLIDGNLVLWNGGENLVLEKFTVSNAVALSVKLGSWESALEKYIDSIEYVTEDLKAGRAIKLSQSEVLRKTGELFALRHLINLRSDLLDTPDFYWDREHLEPLYLRMISHLSINRRTRVMNERLSHCLELVELLSAKLSDRHHVRLEWMIIVLIMVEVAFEFLHYYDRIFGNELETPSKEED